MNDVRYAFNRASGSFMMYSLNNTTKKKPNRSHPDIWHQLFYYQEPRQQNGHTSSYVSKIIDRLQKFLADKGHKNKDGKYMKFFTWLKNFHAPYVQEFSDDNETSPGLWWRLIDSLDATQRILTNKRGKKIGIPPRKGNLFTYFPINEFNTEGCSYIKDEFSRKDV